LSRWRSGGSQPVVLFGDACRKGSDKKTVVDPTLKLGGIASPCVVDVLGMSRIVSGNTASPLILFAESTVNLIRSYNLRGAGGTQDSS
jgi:choline dehydrogenase-like flavoprotein